MATILCLSDEAGHASMPLGKSSAMFVLSMSLFAEPIRKLVGIQYGFGRVYSRPGPSDHKGRITQPGTKESPFMGSGLSKNARHGIAVENLPFFSRNCPISVPER